MHLFIHLCKRAAEARLQKAMNEKIALLRSNSMISKFKNTSMNGRPNV